MQNGRKIFLMVCLFANAFRLESFFLCKCVLSKLSQYEQYI